MRTRRALPLVGVAVAALLLVPLIYQAAMSYGAEFLVWDAQYSTYTYEERPGGFIVLIVGLSLCAVLLPIGVTSAVVSVSAAIGPMRAGRHTAR